MIEPLPNPIAERISQAIETKAHKLWSDREFTEWVDLLMRVLVESGYTDTDVSAEIHDDATTERYRTFSINGWDFELAKLIEQLRLGAMNTPLRLEDGGYTIRLHPEGGGYWASVDELPGCFSQGEGLGEALESVGEAIVLYEEVGDVSQNAMDGLRQLGDALATLTPAWEADDEATEQESPTL